MSRFLILTLFIMNICTATSYGQKWGKPEVYLIDSLDLSYLEPSEKAFIDSVLKKYRSTKNDTVQLRLVSKLAESSDICSCWQQYNDLLLLRSNQLIERGANKAIADKANIYKALYHQNMADHYNSKIAEYELAKMHLDSAINLLKSSSDKAALAHAINTLGYSYRLLGDFSKAMELYKESLALSTKVNAKWDMAASYNNMAAILVEQGDFVTGIEFHQKSIKLLAQIGNKQEYATSLNNLGMIYKNQREYELAIEYVLHGLQIRESIKDRGGIASSLNNLGTIYFAKKELEKAEEFFEKSLIIRIELADKRAMGVINNNLSRIALKKGENQKALDLALVSLKIREEIGDHQGKVQVLVNIGKAYIALNKLKEAEIASMEAMTLAKEKGALDYIQSAAVNLRNIYKQTGRWKQALEMEELNNTMQDSILSQDNQKSVLRSHFLITYERQALTDSLNYVAREAVTKVAMRKDRLMRNGALGGFLVVLMFAGVFFTQRNRIAKEKARSEELLLNILPYEVAEELKENGEALARQMDAVTVLFTDFKGFTQLSERVTPKELVADLNECFSAFDRICEKHGIEKIKTIGDAYMAAGGLPTPNSTHAQDAVNAALEMATFIAEGKARKQSAGLPFFEIRIGIHTGPVVAGIVGIKKFQYDIWGDTVNTASRMESSGEVGRVNISETTYQLVKDHFNCEFRGKVEAKGKGKLGMYFVNTVNSEMINSEISTG